MKKYAYHAAAPAITGLAPQGADDSFFRLQLFSDSAGDAEGQSEAVSGETAPDAGENSTQQPVQNGAQADASDAGKQESFEQLIKGRYKKDFDERVQAILRARFRRRQEPAQDAGPILAALAAQYGMDPDRVDLKALHTKMTQAAQSREEKRRASFDRILAESAQAKERYPSLELEHELENPAFARLLAGAVPVQTAYEIVHKDELLREAMAFAAKQGAQKVSLAVQTNLQRPQENGLHRGSGASVDVTDPRLLTRQMRQDIRKRVRRGEKIVW